MNRRVIFPPADYWTQPKKENTMIDPVSAGDLRRAGAFIKWHSHANRDGMNAILEEALEAKRPSAFIGAILSTYDSIVPMLVTPAGQRGMAEMLLIYADSTNIGEECNRAARFLVAYGDENHELMEEIIRETDDVSPTIVAILDVYAAILPMLHTPSGMTLIERGIRNLSAREVEGDQ